MIRRATGRLLVQDPTLLDGGRPATADQVLVVPDVPPDGFSDGPVCRRVAVVDLDPDTGRPLPPPVRLRPPGPGRVTGRFLTPGGATSRAGCALNAFGVALKTIGLFERPLALGRPVRWAFPGEQLIIVPRAGRARQAAYERRTRSVQFHSFAADGRTVHTALSRDIVAHEVGHALVDGVAPWMADNLGPQSLAMHEALADLVALLVALDLDALRERVLQATGGDLAGPNAFTRIAEEFGRTGAAPGLGDRHALRDLSNTMTVADADPTRPHELSVVLSGLFYDTLATTYASVRSSPGLAGLTDTAAAHRALGAAAQLVQRLLLQGLDLLPPGEVGFADLGRAVLAADRALQPDDPRLAPHRAALAARFVARGIVDRGADLDTAPSAGLAVEPSALPALRDSDHAAYRYVEHHRAELGVPDGVPFRVLPRLDAVKQYGARDAGTGRRAAQRQLILKVAWSLTEPVGDPLLEPVARERRVDAGVSLALRWSDGAPVAGVAGRAAHASGQRADRDAMVRRVLSDGSAAGAAELRLSGGVVEVAGLQRLLHLAGA